VSSAASLPEVADLPPLVAVVGATGTGKTGCAVGIAQHLATQGVSAEIVNADAMQLYRGMDIGTAKASARERGGIEHHLLDVWEVSREASVADYQSMARAKIVGLQARGIIPILVGGSGLYVSSVLYEFEFPGTDPALREELEKRLESEGREALVRELATHDPLAAVASIPATPVDYPGSGSGHLDGQTFWRGARRGASAVAGRFGHHRAAH